MFSLSATTHQSIPGNISKNSESTRTAAHLEGFTAFSHQVLCNPQHVSQSAVLTYLAICTFDYAQGEQGERKGYVFPLTSTISRMRGLSERTIREHLAQLISGGYLVRQRRRNKSSVLRIPQSPTPIQKTPYKSTNRERQKTAVAYIGKKKEKIIKQHVVKNLTLEKLLRIGVNERVALRLCQNHQAEYICSKLDLLAQQLQKVSFGKSIRNPAAWLVQAIEADYQAPIPEEQQPQPANNFAADDYELVVDENGYEVFRPKTKVEGTPLQTLSTTAASMDSDIPTARATTNSAASFLRRYADDTEPFLGITPPAPHLLGWRLRNLTTPPAAYLGVGWSGSQVGRGRCVSLVSELKNLRLGQDRKEKIMVSDKFEGIVGGSGEGEMDMDVEFELEEKVGEEGGMDNLQNKSDLTSEKSSEKKNRKTRKDKGTIQLTDRDLWALEWIGEMTTIRIDQLQRLLGRFAQAQTKQDNILGLKTVERILSRWQRLDLVVVSRILHKESAYVYLTGKGQRQAGLPYKKPWQEKVALLAHYYWVNQARLYVEEKYGEKARWTSERRLFHSSSHVQGHYVDGVIELVIEDEQGSSIEQIAVEVEVTQKTIKRTTETMQRLASAYDNVVYFVLPATRKSVQERIASLPKDIAETFQIVDLSR